MTQEQIDKAFEGRWRIYGNYGKMNQNLATMSFDEFFDSIKEMCRNFFTAGILLADKESMTNPPDSIIFIDTDKIKLSDIVPLNEGSRLALDLNFPFETFWNMYDKKVGKPKCEKLWGKLSAKERMACLDYIPFYVQAQPEKQYRKNPETFLRNKSWNDELIYRNNGTDKPTIDQQRTDKLASILTE